MQKTFKHTLIINSNYYDFFLSLFLGDLNRVFFNRALASTVGVKDGTLTSRALVHPNGFFGNKS